MKITMILDFICPYCFVADKILEEVLKEKKLKPEFKFLPYELCPEPNPEFIVDNSSREYFDKNILLWASNQDILVKFPTVNPKPRTALAFEGIYVAEKYNKQVEYVRAVLDAYWLHNKNIGSIEVLIEIAENLLIPKFEFADALLSGQFKETHQKLNEEVSNFDFDVVPTFYINDEQIKKFPRTKEEWIKILK